MSRLWPSTDLTAAPAGAALVHEATSERELVHVTLPTLRKQLAPKHRQKKIDSHLALNVDHLHDPRLLVDPLSCTPELSIHLKK